MIDTFIQLGIIVFSTLAVYVTQNRNQNVVRWSSIFGLIAQPFWLVSLDMEEQFGAFTISLVYTIIYAKGFYVFWLKK